MTKKTRPGFTVKVVEKVSKYTTELRFICETEAGLSESVGYSGVNEVIQKAIPKIFSFDFPIFDESYRNVLETKILKHYYTREIGLETYGLWKLKLDTKLNEIMPYYNELYKSTLLEFNPLNDVDYTEETKSNKNEEGNGNKTSDTNRDTKNTRTTTSNSNENGQNDVAERNSTEYDTASNTTNTRKYSDTPQGSIDGVIYDNNAYLTNVTFDYNEQKIDEAGISYKDSSEYTKNNKTDNVNENGTINENANTKEITNNTISTTEEYIKNITGKTGGTSYSKLLLEFRETLINVDMMVIKELSELFMNLW